MTIITKDKNGDNIFWNDNRKTDTYLGYEQFYNKMNYQKLSDCVLLKEIRKSGGGFGSFLKDIKHWSWNAIYCFDRKRKGVKE